MAQKPESRLQRRIVKALKKAYPRSWWIKHHGGLFSAAGVPDLLGCVNGLFFALEVKVPGKLRTLSALQSATIQAIQTAGGVSAAIISPEEALALVGSFAPPPKKRSFLGAQVEWILSGLRPKNRKDLDGGRDHPSKGREEHSAGRVEVEPEKYVGEVSYSSPSEVQDLLQLEQFQTSSGRRKEKERQLRLLHFIDEL